MRNLLLVTLRNHDILAVREQTTVLFSTHILSDVERICTDVASLHDGMARVQGKLFDVKSIYRSDEYLLELERKEDAPALMQTFGRMRQNGGCSFSRIYRWR